MTTVRAARRPSPPWTPPTLWTPASCDPGRARSSGDPSDGSPDESLGTRCDRVPQDRPQLAGGAAAGIAEVNLMVPAARPVAGGGDGAVQAHDRGVLGGVRADVQQLGASALFPSLVPEAAQRRQRLPAGAFDGTGDDGDVNGFRLQDHDPPAPAVAVGGGHRGQPERDRGEDIPLRWIIDPPLRL